MIAPGGVARRLWSQPYLLLVATTLAWGGNAVAGRLAVGEVSPMAITCLRWVIVLAVLAVLARRQTFANWREVAPYWRRTLILGGLGFTVFNALFYQAAVMTSAVNLGLIQGVMPAIVLAGGALVYGTRIRAVQVVGIAVAILGVLVAASRGDVDVLRRLAFNAGDVAMLFGSILYAGYTLALRRPPPIPPLTFFAALAAGALLTSIPLLAWEVAAGRVIWPSPKGWLILLFIGTMPSLAAQLLYMRGVALIGPARAGLFINLVPIFAALLAVVILGEAFRPYHAVALALVLGGIGLAESRRRAL